MNHSNPFLKEIFPVDWLFKKAPVEQESHEELAVEELVESLDQFSKEALKDKPKAKIIINEELEISRPGEGLTPVSASLKEHLEKQSTSSRHVNLRYGGKSAPVKLMVIGEFFQAEAKNQLEASFSSEAAQLLGKMLKAMNLEEKDYFISAVKLNETDEDFLAESIRQEAFFLRPKVIMPMGSIATQALLNNKERLSRVQGKIQERIWRYESGKKEIKIVPIYHPDYLLINTDMKKAAWEGMKKIVEEFS